ncbi:MAG: hypothetical protein ACE5F1_04045 [Planctomycetota bacterium]
MFDDTEELSGEDALELLEELELSQPEEVSEQRQSEWFPFKHVISLDAGNASQTGQFRRVGMTSQLSRMHILCIFDKPILVGDVYRLDLAADRVKLSSTFALCERCRLLGDKGYEASFKFFVPVEISSKDSST